MINDKAREISADEYSDRQSQIDGMLRDLHTALPAIVISYDPVARTVKAQPTVQRIFKDIDGAAMAVNLPPSVDVPVVFPSGGGYEITFPVRAGDECLLIFAERCIDGWYSTGEPSAPSDYRRHDLSDGFALVGVRSLARQKAAITNGVKIGSDNHNIVITEQAVSIKNGGATLSLSEDRLDCNVEIHCKNVITEKLDLNGHIHSGVEVGGGETLEGH